MATRNPPAREGSAADRTGLEDVTRSVRQLARSGRDLGESAAKVAERELAMAVDVASNLRDRVISRESLKEARENELSSRLRRDAHQIVDLTMDVGTVVVLNVVRFFEGFADEPRPPLETTASGSAS